MFKFMLKCCSKGLSHCDIAFIVLYAHTSDFPLTSESSADIHSDILLPKCGKPGLKGARKEIRCVCFCVCVCSFLHVLCFCIMCLLVSDISNTNVFYCMLLHTNQSVKYSQSYYHVILISIDINFLHGIYSFDRNNLQPEAPTQPLCCLCFYSYK